jgi:hypothetical protein
MGPIERWWVSHWETAIIGSVFFAMAVLMVAILCVGLIYT